MYRINYAYYERDEKDRVIPKGQPIIGFVEGETIEQLNKRYTEMKENHDLFKYTLIIFRSIEEIWIFFKKALDKSAFLLL